MRVTIDGRDYVLATDTFRLTDAHFEAAAGYENSFDLIRWAHDNQAGVPEMLAWGRAIDVVMPLPVTPVKKSGSKPTPLTTGHLKSKAKSFEFE